MAGGSLDGAGNDGFYWSEVSHASSFDAYYLSFGSISIYASSYTARWLGFTVQIKIEARPQSHTNGYWNLKEEC